MLDISNNVSFGMLHDVYHDSYIIDRIKDDSCTPSPITHPAVKYLAIHKDSEFLGLVLCVQHNIYEVEMHSLLKKNSRPYSREIGHLVVSKVFEDNKVLRATATVNDSLPSTKNFLTKIGFIEEGVKKEAVIKNSKIYDVVVMGITKTKWRNS